MHNALHTGIHRCCYQVCHPPDVHRRVIFFQPPRTRFGGDVIEQLHALHDTLERYPVSLIAMDDLNTGQLAQASCFLYGPHHSAYFIAAFH